MRTSLVVLAASSWTAAQDNADGFYLGAGLDDFSTDIADLDDVDDVDLEIESGNTTLIDERVNLRAEYEVVEIDRLEDSHAVWLTAAWRF